MIAERVTDNIRALEGALIRVVAFHSLTRRPIDAALTAEVLDVMYPVGPSASRVRGPTGGRSGPLVAPRPAQPPTIAEIQTTVADAFGITVEQLVSSSRAPSSTGPASSRSNSPAISPAPRCRRSVASSAAATTQPCCTRASAYRTG